MTRLNLVSFPTCPYVQRAVIALEEKGVDFSVDYIDLAQKPDWFLAISPLGKVPLLRVGRPGETDAILFESAVILEYLEETAPGPRLHPEDPLERARHRAWIEFGSTLLGDLWRLGSARTDEDVSSARDVLRARFARLEEALGEGPFFAGERFSNVDAAFAPAFRQIDVLEDAAAPRLLAEFPKVDEWRGALSERPSVRAAAPADYAERYLTRLRSQDARILQAAARGVAA